MLTRAAGMPCQLQFDFVVVVVSVAGVLTDYLSSASLTFVPLLRVLRVLRIVKLIPKAKGLRMLMMTLLWTLPAFLNVTSVVVLVMFIYSIIGMNLFGAVKLGENLDRNGNFQTFPTSMLLLFRQVSHACGERDTDIAFLLGAGRYFAQTVCRMIVGENWNGVMLDCMVTTECVEVINTVMLSNGTTVWAGTYFDPNDTNSLSALPVGSTFNRCSPNGTVTILYFCSYMLIMLVIAIILENCEMQSKKENYRFRLHSRPRRHTPFAEATGGCIGVAAADAAAAAAVVVAAVAVVPWCTTDAVFCNCAVPGQRARNCLSWLFVNIITCVTISPAKQSSNASQVRRNAAAICTRHVSNGQ
eukprot:364557-Chlamydomonas_euryale.AAC.18